MTELLIADGSSLNITNKNGQTALSIACGAIPVNKLMVSCLIGNSANIDAKDCVSHCKNKYR